MNSFKEKCFANDVILYLLMFNQAYYILSVDLQNHLTIVTYKKMKLEQTNIVKFTLFHILGTNWCDGGKKKKRKRKTPRSIKTN